MKRLSFILSLVLFTGCYPYVLMGPVMGQDVYTIVRVESDTEWSGIIGHQVVEGFGDKSFPMPIGTCWDIGKRRPVMGMVRTFATYNTYYKGNNGRIPVWSDRATTSAVGRVRGCV